MAVTAAASPWLVDLIRAVYVALGGQLALGPVGATIVRLLLAALVLGAPTVLMGGTLPAAVRAVTTADDRHRRAAALLYGANTLGAVLGVAVSTFFALEVLGTRTTLWSACAINAITALVAFGLSRRGVPTTARAPAAAARKSRPRPKAAPLPQGGFVLDRESSGSSHARLIYLAAGTVGFAFFLMELVWYRMLGPLLGGTTFTFGLILGEAVVRH